MPIRSFRVPRLGGGILLLWMAASAGALDLKGTLAGGPQSYSSDSLSAALTAWDLEASAAGRPSESLYAKLRIRSLSDLYDRRDQASLLGRWMGEALSLRGQLTLSRRDPGELTLPLLVFDPDSLIAQEEAERGYRSGKLALGMDWLGEGAEGRVDLELASSRYERSDDTLSDRDEDRLSAGLSFFMPASLMLELEAVGEGERYRDRPASNRRAWQLGAGLSRFIGDAWNLRLKGGAAWQSVEDAAVLPEYERPGGRTLSAELLADLFSSKGEGSLRLVASREAWDAYDGYFRDGWTTRAELAAFLPLAERLRLESFLALDGFEPDSLPESAWTSERGRERRLEYDFILKFLPGRPLSFDLSLLGEQTRILGDGEDEFNLVQVQLGLRWRPASDRRVELTLSLDEYESRYEGEDPLRETGLSGSLSAAKSWGPRRLGLEISRNRRYSFLEDEGPIEDWELRLELGYGGR